MAAYRHRQTVSQSESRRMTDALRQQQSRVHSGVDVRVGFSTQLGTDVSAEILFVDCDS